MTTCEKENLLYIFNLEKAYDKVSRYVLWNVLCEYKVEVQAFTEFISDDHQSHKCT